MVFNESGVLHASGRVADLNVLHWFSAIVMLSVVTLKIGLLSQYHFIFFLSALLKVQRTNMKYNFQALDFSHCSWRRIFICNILRYRYRS
jgi:hypothetical protein